MNRMAKAATVTLGCVLIGAAGCGGESGTEQQMEEASQEVEGAAEKAAAETEQAAGEAGQQIEAAFDDVNIDADSVIDQEDWSTWWEESDWFSNWDLDASGYVTENELKTAFQGRAFGEEFDTSLFTQWDEDGNDRLNEEELRESLFGWLDEDDDDQLGSDEWKFEASA